MNCPYVLQLVMHTKAGKMEDRLSPWATRVTCPEKVPVYDQIFWDPPQVGHEIGLFLVMVNMIFIIHPYIPW